MKRDKGGSTSTKEYVLFWTVYLGVFIDDKRELVVVHLEALQKEAKIWAKVKEGQRLPD